MAAPYAGGTPRPYDVRKPIHAPYPQQTLAVGACAISPVPVVPEGAVGLLFQLHQNAQTTPARKMRFRDNKMGKNHKHVMMGMFFELNSCLEFANEERNIPTFCVLPDSLALPKVQATSKTNVHLNAHCDTTGAFVSGACNVRCAKGEAHLFQSNDIVFVKPDTDGFFAATPNEGNAIGVLGHCIEDGDKGASTVRVYVDNALSTYTYLQE